MHRIVQAFVMHSKRRRNTKRQIVSQVTVRLPPPSFLRFRPQQDAHRGTGAVIVPHGDFLSGGGTFSAASGNQQGRAKYRYSVVRGAMQRFSKLDSLFARELYFRDNSLPAPSDF